MAPITVLIPVSPIPSHPDPVILETTMDSIRERLPDAPIVLMFDGVSPQTAGRQHDYQMFINHMLWDAEHKYGNVVPIAFRGHQHQSGMTKMALDFVDTELLLWSEQDTPLVNHIPFDELAEVVRAGYANIIRFSHEALILPDHQSLMLDAAPINVMGVPLIRTYQWSGRPHLASTRYYREIAATWDAQPRFIEHIMYGPVTEEPYDLHRLHIYAPEAPHPHGTFVRSLHLDGRRYGAAEYDASVSMS